MDIYSEGSGGRHQKPCRACTDFKSWMKTGPNQTNDTGSKSNENQSQSTSGNHNQDKPLESSGTVKTYENCPLDKDELGNKTWGFLHTMSVYLPSGKLEPSQQTDLRSFINLFSKFYPCDICASDMRKDIKDEKPNVDTGYDFAQWLCRLHNKTNIKLGKPVFDCSKVFERWKDGPTDGSCD